MNIIKDIILFFKRIFRKENEIKMLNPVEEKVHNEDKIRFINSLKVGENRQQRKKKIETLVCHGDGLGIQNKISY